jgi:hypothetical protein
LIQSTIRCTLPYGRFCCCALPLLLHLRKPLGRPS